MKCHQNGMKCPDCGMNDETIIQLTDFFTQVSVRYH